MVYLQNKRSDDGASSQEKGGEDGIYRCKYLIQWVSPRLYIYIGVYTASTGIKVVLQLRHIAFDHLLMLHVNHLATGLFVLIFVQVCPL